MSKKIFLFFAFFLLWMPYAVAASAGSACHDLTFQVIERGEDEIAPDTCGKDSFCQEEVRRKGMVVKKRFVRLKVVTSGVGPSCPGSGTVYRLQGVITEARIRATLILTDGKDAGQASERHELRNIRSMGGSRLPGFGAAIVLKE